ncbi:MAG: hypothetical protein J6A01_03180 [Proteobacteria bacterium]|nr:hypothetical protein [Pseudomonadota bacterium]
MPKLNAVTLLNQKIAILAPALPGATRRKPSGLLENDMPKLNAVALLSSEFFLVTLFQLCHIHQGSCTLICGQFLPWDFVLTTL